MKKAFIVAVLMALLLSVTTACVREVISENDESLDITPSPTENQPKTGSLSTPRDSSSPNTFLPQLMINDVIYFLYGDPYTNIPNLPESYYKGYIESTVLLSQKPAVNGQANFDVEIGAPYAKYGNGYIVQWNDIWTVFVTENDLLSGVTPTPQKIISNAPEHAPTLDVILTPGKSQQQRVVAKQLTTSWMIEYEDGTGNGYDSDSPHVLQLKPMEFDEPTLLLFIGDGIVELQFSDDYPPESVSVQRWKHSWGYLNKKYSNVEYNKERLAYAIGFGESVEINGNTICIENDGSDYIYEINVIWPNGTVYYTFRTISSDINKFWMGFREAVLRRDYSSIATFVSFPLETRGPWDWGPIVLVDAGEFESVFSAFLEQDGDTWFETSFDSIEQTLYLDSYELDTARAGNMHLERINGEWKITLIYIEEDE